MTASDPGFDALIPGLLKDWILSPDGQHEPPASGLKGNLTGWKEIESAKLPTVRRDLAQAVVDGKVYKDGISVMDHMVRWLSDDAKVVLYSRSLVR